MDTDRRIAKTLEDDKAVTADGRDFRSILGELARTRSSLGVVYRDFCRITACCLAMETREDEYKEAIRGYSPDELNQLALAMARLIDEMDCSPFSDLLGVFYTDVMAATDRTARGEFNTPPPVSEMMARMTFDPEKIREEGVPVTVLDPCAGSGGLVLECARSLAPDHVDLLRVTLQDINPVACDMGYINTTLWGIPAEIILGNTLTTEHTNRWTNLHWARVGEEQRRRSIRMLAAFREVIEPVEPIPKHSERGSQPTNPTTGEQLGLFRE